MKQPTPTVSQYFLASSVYVRPNSLRAAMGIKFKSMLLAEKRFQLPGKNSEADTQTAGASFVTANRSPQKNGLQGTELEVAVNV